ncbi:MAG: hypothetical protein M3O09_17355 [Acidobacteriota bacterium]|nr:hypothetical protein [Acidobacteriota bacterium]
MNGAIKVVLLLFVAVAISRAQVKHAPSVEQCRADQRLWLAQLESSGSLPNYRTLQGWNHEMGECSSVDSENQARYFNVRAEVVAEQASRVEEFLSRHNLYDKFIEEDNMGKR